MTFREAYHMGTEKLSVSGIDEASLDAWYLLEYVTGISRASFLADPEKMMEDTAKERYLEVLRRRAKRIPLQHITGVQEFMGLEFMVNEHVLIPRQDTEILVETALEEMKRRLQSMGKSKEGESADVKQRLCILDMCTGSGCILLSMLYYAKQEAEKCGFSVVRHTAEKVGGRFWACCTPQEEKTGMPKHGVEILGLGVDVSEEALRVAKQNGENLRIEAEWLESDLFAGVEGAFDMILSNPPYIPSAVIKTLQLEVREHDPELALDGKEDGLYFYRRIAEEGRKYLNPGGYLIFEIGSEQGEAVSSYMKTCGYTQVEVRKDLAGLDRIVCGVYDN